jgi:DNA-binding CsgD family transcriptional regulator
VTVMISARPRSAVLSNRECEILEHLAGGQSIGEISGTLFLSPHTVRTHIKNILRKTGTRNRAHAVALALFEQRIAYEPDSYR